MLAPTTWIELSPSDCVYFLGSCSRGRFLYTDRALPAVQPTSFELDGSRLLFLAPPRFKISRGHVFSFHVQAEDAAWTVTAHGPVDLQHHALPQSSPAAGAESPRPFAVDPNEPLALDIQLLIGDRLQRRAEPARAQARPYG